MLNNSRAESLLEAVSAITVLGIAAVGIVELLFIAIRGNDLSQDRLIAYQLTREGVMAVDIMVDTNALRFTGAIEDCWDKLEATNAADCASSSSIAMSGDADGSTYSVYRNVGNSDEAFAWIFSENPSPEQQQLYEYTIAGKTFWTPRLGDNLTFAPAPTSTPYRRTVTVQKQTTLSPDDTLAVTSTVSWEWHSQTKSVSSIRKIYKPT